MKSIFILSETGRYGHELAANLPVEDFEVFTAASFETALCSIEDKVPNILIYDLDLYIRMRPKQVCNLLFQTLGQQLPLVLLHQPSFGLEKQISSLKPVQCFKKPVRGDSLAKWLIDHPSEMLEYSQLTDSSADFPEGMGSALVVEESGTICDQMAREVPHRSLTFVGARSIKDAVDEVKFNRPSLIVYDLDIPCHIDSEEALTLINAWENVHIPTVILVNSFEDIDCVLERCRADAFQIKPVSGTFIAQWLKHNLDIFPASDNDFFVGIEKTEALEDLEITQEQEKEEESCEEIDSTANTLEAAKQTEICLEVEEEQLEPQRQEAEKELKRKAPEIAEIKRFGYGSALYVFTLLFTHLLCLYFILPAEIYQRTKSQRLLVDGKKLAQCINECSRKLSSSVTDNGTSNLCVNNGNYDVLQHVEMVNTLLLSNSNQATEQSKRASDKAVGYLLKHHFGQLPGRTRLSAIWLTAKKKRAPLLATARSICSLRNYLSMKDLKALGSFICFMQRSDGSFTDVYSSTAKSGFREGRANLRAIGEAALALLVLEDKKVVGPWRNNAIRALRFVSLVQSDQPYISPHESTAKAIAKLLKDLPASSTLAHELGFHLIQVCERITFDGANRFGSPLLYGCLTDDGSLLPTAKRTQCLIFAFNSLTKDERELKRLIPTIIKRATVFLCNSKSSLNRADKACAHLNALLNYQVMKGRD